MVSIDKSEYVSQVGFNRALDFCVRVLEIDGLKVPPFTRHADGDGRLRALGLREGNWTVWTDIVARALHDRLMFDQAMQIETRRHLDQVLEEDERLVATGIARKGLTGTFQLLKTWVALFIDLLRANAASAARLGKVPYPNPALLWPEEGPLRQELLRMWRRYMRGEVGNRRRFWKTLHLISYLTSPAFEEFKSSIRKSHAGITDPIVSFVYYPGIVVYPTSAPVVIIGAKNWAPSPEAFRQVVRAALGRLSSGSTGLETPV